MTETNRVSEKADSSSTTGARPSILVDDSQLFSLRARPSLIEYFRSLWQRRHFIHADARSKAFKSNRDMLLGRVWIILNPLLDVAVYGVVFGLVLKTSRGIDNFIGFLILGVIFFGFISKGLSAGSGLIQSSRNMISSFAFPKASLAVSVILRQLLDNIVPAIVAVILAVLLQIGEPLSWTIILVVPLFLLIHVFGLGLTFFVSRITAFVPDFKAIVSLVGRALFFLSGVFFSVERFSTSPELQQLVLINPAYQFLMAVRDAAIYQTVPSAGTWAYLSAWSFGLVVVGFVFFWQAEERYASAR